MSKVADYYEEFRSAQYALQQAQHNFDQADPDFVDVASYQLKMAEEKFNLVVRQAKLQEKVS